MTRLVITLALLCSIELGGCFRDHPAAQVELMGKDCYGCHATDYAATAAPVHRDSPQVFSTACANCHRTVGWQPALEGLHGSVFVISRGAHAPIACLGCHDLASAQPSKAGANTNCIQCHPDDAHQREVHLGATSTSNAPYAYLAAVPNFCLSCHPTGIGEHPDDRFARRGRHDVPCAQCHDRAAGPDTAGANVTCVASSCHHTLGVADAIDDHRSTRYQTARGNGTSRNFCHQCHS